MTHAFFLTINGSKDLADRVRETVERDIVPGLRARGEVKTVSLFTPETGQDDPYTSDDAPPRLMIQVDADDLDQMRPFLGNAELTRLLEDAPAGSVTCEAFRTTCQVIEGVAEPTRREAPLSFNVRYYAPIEDAERFVDFYLRHHPQILAELPGIRNVFCYVPVAWTNPTGIPVSNCILGNEVVFDSVDALNDALASDVRHRLREDYNAFPVRPGPNTHYAMRRRDFRID
jgi:hypothetical protein